jgi:hypothetical protein
MKVYASRFNIYLAMFTALTLFCGCQTHHSAVKEDKQISALRIHIEANVDPAGTSQTVSVLRSEPVSVTIDHNPILTEADIVGARVLDAPAGAGFAVEVKLADMPTLLLEQYTASNPGKHFVVWGQWGDKGKETRWLAAPLITHRISNGVLAFTPDMSRDDAYRLVLGLNNLAKKTAKGAMK